MSDLITRQTTISGNIVLLCRFLRSKGFNLSTSEEADALKAVSQISIGNKAHFGSALKIILAKNKWQYEHFEDFYFEFWQQLKKAVDSKTKDLPEVKDQTSNKSNHKGPTFEELKSWLYNKPTDGESELAVFSNVEILARKDFSSMSEEEMNLVLSLLKKMAHKITHQKSRLNKISKKARRLNLKQTLRHNWRRGGEIQSLVFSEPKDKKLKLVLICDVSRSMDLYSRFLVHFIYAFQNAYDRIDTFVFSTVLVRVSELLDNLEFHKAFEAISERVPQWSGGTRIGASLKEFLDTVGERSLDRKTVLIVLSDGWDTGEPEILNETMRRLHKLSRKVIWLNPLAGNPDYLPEVTGIKAAMPFIDVFAPAHNLESLKLAMAHLKRNRKRLSLK